MTKSLLSRFTLVLAAGMLSACSDGPLDPRASTETPAFANSRSAQPIAINVGLTGPLTREMEAELSGYARVAHQIPELDVVLMVGPSAAVSEIAALPFVRFAEPDVEASTGPLDAEMLSDLSGGFSTWNLDAINVTSEPGPGPRAVAQTGEGVYVGVLDTGLLHTWRLYFPEERIATEYAKAVSGGWHPNASNPETPNVWEQDVGGHGTHVTSTIIGYDFLGTPINGVAPKATVIPVKVLGQRGSGWVSMIAEGLVYVAGLKAGPLNGNPVVVNMSLGTAAPAALMRVAVDFAIANGVIVVSSAGNEGAEGMSYPAAYEPVISVASAGWGDCLTWPDVTSTSECFGQWTTRTWWNSRDVFENTVDQFYISDFSSRALEDQDLDVVAPGDGVVGPFQLDRSVHADYFFLRGTSMASPHVAGIVALMAEKHPGLSAAQAEAILEGAAQPMAPGTHHPLARGPACCFELSWEDDATGHGFITADAALAGTP